MPEIHGFVNRDDVVRPRRMLVVGLGGGGCNVVGRMSGSWHDGPDLCVINTDARALESCAVPQQLQIGKNLTHGLGAGGDVAVGKMAADDDADLLRSLVSQTDMVFIVVTLGGGTGTGAAPLLAKIAREEGALTICFASMPFDFEGEHRKGQAREGFQALKEECDAMVCLPNQGLLEMVNDRTSVQETFQTSDRVLGLQIKSLWRLLSQNGMINIDFADVRNMVDQSGGVCYFGFGEGSGTSRADQAVRAVMDSPLLERGHILSHANALLVCILGGSDLTLVDIQKVMQKIKSLIRSDARMTMGALVDEVWSGRMAIMLLVAEARRDAPSAQTARGDVRAAPAGDTAAGAPAAGIPPAAQTARGEVRAPTGKKSAVQATLNFDPSEKGRFSNIEPTLYNGEDLDIPTYVRRGIRIAMER
ncbi:MAG: cell division protein FtsZ [Lentisphaerota bacterium]